MSEYELYERPEPAVTDWEQSLIDSVRKDDMWETIEELVQHRRQAGTEDERRAAEYIRERLEEYNLPVDWWDPEMWVTHPNDASIRAVSPVEEEVDTDMDRPAIKPQSWSGNGSAQGEVVYLDIPEVSVKEFRNITLDNMVDDDQDLTDKIVVVGKQILSGRIARAVEERGAAGYVAVHPHEEEAHQRAATRIWGTTPTPDTADLLPEIPLLTAASPIGDQIQDLFEEHGTLQLEISAEAPREWSNCPIIRTKIEAEDPINDDFVLLHGHYDSIEFGATDNATGDAGMIEIARILANNRGKLNRDLWVAFWPAHERLYAGSTWFVDEYAHEFMDSCIAHINMDSTGAKDATEFEEYVSWMPETDELCRSAIDDVAGKDSVENRTRRAGDYSLYNIGVTGMLCLNSSIPKPIRDERGYHTVSGAGGNSDAWHLTTDTLDNADPNVQKRDTMIYLTVVARLLGNDVVPLDHRRSIEHARDIVQDYDSGAGDDFDLQPVIGLFDDISDGLEEFYEAVETDTIGSELANETIKEISRLVIPIDYVKGGRFEQDLMTQRPPFPSLEPATALPELDGNDHKFQHLELKRSRNEVTYRLKQAKRHLEAANEAT